MKTSCISHLFASVAPLLVAQAIGAATYYVSPYTGDDAYDGLSAASPRATVASAYADAADGDTILLAPGVHTLSQTLVIGKAVSLQGTDRICTTLKAASTGYRLITINNADAEVAGVTIRDVAAGNVAGFGVFIGANGGTLRDARVTGCSGGNNDNSGAVAFAASSPGSVRRTIIDGNHASGYGGGVHYQGGAAGAVLENCLVVGNSANWGGGLYANAGNITILNCTIANNKSANNSADYYYYSGKPTVRNTIIGSGYFNVTGGTYYQHCATSPVQSGEGNVAYSAQFRDSSAFDYRLAVGSAYAAAGAALETGMPETDLEGNRHDPAAPSLGCHAAPSADGLDVAFQVDLAGITVGSAAVLSATVSHATSAATCSWFVGGDSEFSAETNTAADVQARVEIGAIGRYGVRLLVADQGATYAVARFNVFEIGALTNYVSLSGSATYPYDTWETAAHDIPSALDAAVPGATILVDDGTWTLASQLEITEPIALVSRNGRDATRLAAGGGDRLLYLNDPQAVVKGFTLSGVRRTVSHSIQWNFGGAACIDSLGGVVEDCIFEDNAEASAFHGVAIAIRGNASAVRRTIFRANATQAAVYGTVYMAGGTLENCLVYGNTAQYGGGVYIENAPATVLNCTIVNNTSTAGSGQGMDIYNYRQPSVIANCIAGPVNNRYGNTATNNLLNISAAVQEALFFDTSTANYALKPDAVAVDAGADIDGVGPFDVLGAPRVQGEAIDIGACEYGEDSLDIGFTCEPAGVFSGGEVRVRPVFEASGDASLAWMITRAGGAAATYTTTGHDTLSVSFDTPGVYEVAVEIRVGGRVARQSKPAAFRVGVRDAYVSKTGNATFPYDTPAKATPDPATAVAVGIDGTKVHVGPGTYDLERALEITDGLDFIGEAGKEHTVLRHDAAAANDSVLFINNSGACVSGFTICGGRYTGGLRGNAGAGVCIQRSGGRLQDCIVSNNLCGLNVCGAGIAVYGAHATVSRCLIADNGVMPGVGTFNSWGGGVYFAAGVSHLDNCLVFRNRCGYGGGTYTEGSAIATLTNCTIVANGANERGGGIYNYNAGQTHVIGSAICGNSAGSVETPPVDDIAWAWNNKNTISYCAGTFESQGVMTLDLDDFGFKNAAAGIFRLVTGSPLIDAGVAVPWLASERDLDGKPRVRGAAPDIGCFEFGRDATIILAQ